jgi:S-adenosyl-L-methionine hydrolase (adenosine-forming)
MSMNMYRGMLAQMEHWLDRIERPPIITMTTDFGLYDGYVGTMKGVIHTLLPDATVVDISHDIRPHQIDEGAFTLYRSYRYFPASAVHIAVVDPGVGSSRRPIALTTHHGSFIGPDNGIFTYVLRAEMAPHDHPEMASGPAWAGGMWGVAPAWAGDETVAKRRRSSEVRAEGEGQVNRAMPRAYHLNNPDYWLPSISSTFHGRDIFAPAATHLASGAHPDRMGNLIPLDSLVKLPIGAPRVHRSGKTITILGQIVHVDRFGNIITNLPERLLAPYLEDMIPTVEIAGHVIKGLAGSYADVREGQPLAIIGSERLLEVAVRNSNAAHRMKVNTGDPVKVVVVRE